MEKKWTNWYITASHVIAYRSKELLFGMHAFDFNCFLDDFDCVFTQIRCLSVLLAASSKITNEVFHENCLLAYLIFLKIRKDVENLSSAAVVIGALRVNHGILQRNYRKMTIKWSFSYNSFVKVYLYQQDSLITWSISMDPKQSVIKVLHCYCKISLISI